MPSEVTIELLQAQFLKVYNNTPILAQQMRASGACRAKNVVSVVHSLGPNFLLYFFEALELSKGELSKGVWSVVGMV